MNGFCLGVRLALALAIKFLGFSTLWPKSQRLPAAGGNVRHQTRSRPDGYISRIAVERALRSLEEAPAEAISFHHATEAAHVLLATFRRHARRFALAMHSPCRSWPRRRPDRALGTGRDGNQSAYTGATDNGVGGPLRPGSRMCDSLSTGPSGQVRASATADTL
jgi:hypothetical protein